MNSKKFTVDRLTTLLVCILSLTTVSVAQAADIQVVTNQGDLTLNCPGEFSLRFSKALGGGISEYYDLVQVLAIFRKRRNLILQAYVFLRGRGFLLASIAASLRR